MKGKINLITIFMVLIMSMSLVYALDAPTLSSPSNNGEVKDGTSITYTISGTNLSSCTIDLGVSTFTGSFNADNTSCSYSYVKHDVPSGVVETTSTLTQVNGTTATSGVSYLLIDNGNRNGFVPIQGEIELDDVQEIQKQSGAGSKLKMVAFLVVVYLAYVNFAKKK